MLARTHRFHGYGSLNSVYRAGQTARSPLINLRYVYREPQRPYRVAIVVSRKVSKSAVVRNRIRRRLYEAIRRQAEILPSGLDLVFTVFGDQLATMEAERLETTVSQLLEKASQSPEHRSVVV